MFKFAILAAASLVAAQDNSTCSKFLNATSQADLDKISSCSTFDASLSITTSDGVLTLNGVKKITGDLSIIDSSQLSSFSAPSLQTVQGTLDLERLTILRTLSLPQVTELDGIKFLTLPALEQLQFNTGVEKAKNILISDTALKSLQGLNLSDVDNFQINNNKNINDISVTATQISEVLDVSFNAAKVNVSFPNLVWVKNATFRFCSSIDMPKLTTVNNSLGFVNNTVRTLDYQNLSSVGSLTISSNSDLSNVSFPQLTTINGGFVIANNSRYQQIYGFPKLETVRGAIVFQGNLTQASLPKLSEVDGGVNVDSSNTFNCSTFDQAHQNGDFHGDAYVCKGVSHTISTKLSPTSSGSGSDSGSGSGNQGASSTGSSGSGSGSSSSSGSKKKSKNSAPVATISSSVLGVFMAALLQIV